MLLTSLKKSTSKVFLRSIKVLISSKNNFFNNFVNTVQLRSSELPSVKSIATGGLHELVVAAELVERVIAAVELELVSVEELVELEVAVG